MDTLYVSVTADIIFRGKLSKIDAKSILNQLKIENQCIIIAYLNYFFYFWKFKKKVIKSFGE